MQGLNRLLFGSFRRKLILVVTLTNALLMAGFIWDASERQRQLLLDRQTEHAVALAHSMGASAAAWLSSQDYQGLQELLNAQNRYPDLSFAMILDMRGHIVAHTDPSHLKQYVLDLPSPDTDPVEIYILHHSVALVDALSPILLANTQIGWVRVGLSGQSLNQHLDAIYRDAAKFGLLSILISSICVNIMGRHLTRRLQIIRETSDAIQAGDHTRRVHLTGFDEAAALGHALDSMLDTLALRNHALRLANERLQAATRAGIVGIWEWDIVNRTLIWDEVMYRLYGIRAENFPLTPGNWLKRLHPDDQPTARRDIRRALRGQWEYTTEFRILWPEGGIHHLKSAAQVIHDDQGKPLRMVGVNYDLTERKRAEAELKRSNRELEQFAYAVSHDMRQPLRMINSYLQLIEKALKDQLDDDTRQFLHFATDGARRMDGMILALLDFSRVGRKTSPMEALNLREALDEALTFLGPDITTSTADIDIAGDWPALIASRDEMVRLFQNLVGNALKYHELDTAPVVRIIGSLQNGCWHCAISDRGIGIEPSQTARLFQVFSRLQAQTHFPGAGVGLALCRKIVEHHGGRIGVESPGEGQGSTFWFELPLKSSLTQVATSA